MQKNYIKQLILLFFQPVTLSNDCILFSPLTVKQNLPLIPVGSTKGRNLIDGICTLSPVVAVTTTVFTVVR
jgi:hypothetical protein